MDTFINQIKNYSSVKGKLNLFITFFFFDTNHEDLLKYLNYKIKIINTIKDSYKRKKALDRIFLIKDNIKEYKENYFSNKGILYLVNEELEKIELKSNVLKVARSEFKDNIFYDSGDFFATDYLIDMLTNFEFNNLVLMDKKVYIYNINTNKTKLIHTIDKPELNSLMSEINSKISGPLILGGNGNLKNNFYKENKNSFIKDIKITSFKPDKIEHIKEDALKVFQEEAEISILDLLDNYINDSHQYTDLLVYNNKRILKFVENCMAKTVIIHKSSPIYKEIKEMDLSSIDNFHVLESKNEKCKSFINNYEGSILEMRYVLPQNCFDED